MMFERIQQGAGIEKMIVLDAERPRPDSISVCLPAIHWTMQPRNPHAANSLHWQSQAVLLAFVPAAAVWVTLEAGQLWERHDAILLETAIIAVALAGLVSVTRAATPAAAATGAIFAATLYLETPGLHTALWPLSALLALTFSATRFGRRRKEALGLGEARRGRTPSQVAANLGVAALAGIPFTEAHLFTPMAADARVALVAMMAALAEATADTVSSELGQVLGGTPRLLTTFRRVPAGTDGAVSMIGTLLGMVAAGLVVAVGWLTLPSLTQTFSRADALVALAGGTFGLFFDSLLGATIERRGWLNNDAVNALSTLAAALMAAWLTRWV